MDKRFLKSNKKAQQLAEFLLVAPLLMIFILILVEFSFALNARITLAEAVKNSVFKAKQNVYSNTLISEIQSYIQTYLSDHNIPNSDSATVSAVVVDDNTMILAHYSYIPVFKLSSMFGNIIPDKYNFTSYQLIDNAYLNASGGFGSTLTTSNLSSFGFLGIGLDRRNGVIKDQAIDGTDARTLTAFMVDFGTAPNGNKIARVFDWFGTDLLPKTHVFDMQTGYLMTSTDGVNWTDTTTPYTWFLMSRGYTHALYTPIKSGAIAPTPYATYTLKNNSNSTWISWCNQPTTAAGTCSTSSTDDFVSDSNVNNMVKRAFGGLHTATPIASGSFEPTTGTNSVISPNSLKTTEIWNSTNKYYLKVITFNTMNVITTLPSGGEPMPGNPSTLTLTQSSEYATLKGGTFSTTKKVTSSW